MSAPDRGSKPLTSSAFYVLLALVDSERHGLGIVEEIEHKAGDDVTLGPGTLYHTLHKLAASNLIEESPSRPRRDHDDPRRRYYRITHAGRRAVTTEAARIDRVLQVARDKQLLPE